MTDLFSCSSAVFLIVHVTVVKNIIRVCILFIILFGFLYVTYCINIDSAGRSMIA